MENYSEIVTLSLGSNLGDKKQNLLFAIDQIGLRIGPVFKISDFFESKPWGFSSQNDFLNCCCLVKSELKLESILFENQLIEIEMGRLKESKQGYNDRLIDIDIIFFGSQILKTERITLPHPRYRTRDFVLIPLSQLSDQIDPETFVSTHQLTS